MGLRLSTAEVAALALANSVLLAPLSYENGESWRRAAARSIQNCLRGDGSSFALPIPGEPLIAAEPDVAHALRAIDPPPDWVVEGLVVRRRERGLTVTDWEELFDADQIRRTAFYNEVVLPHGLAAPVVMMKETGVGALPSALSVYFADERAARRHVKRHKDLLRILYPAYCAGLATYIAYRQNYAALTSLAEDAGIGVLLFDARGLLQRENAFFKQLMSGDPDRDRVRAEAARAVRALLSLPTRGVGANATRRTRSELRSAVGLYRISATFFELPWHDSIQAVALVDRVDARVDARELATRFSLTQREIEIALLLRNGLSSRQISSALGISINTVRRHVERVMLKLDVHTRTAAAAKLVGD